MKAKATESGHGFEPSRLGPKHPGRHRALRAPAEVTALLILFVIPSTTRAQVARQFTDPPAIDVHPEHDDVVRGKVSLNAFVADGKKLFRTVFNAADGAGRPCATGDSKPTPREIPEGLFQRVAGPDASSCNDCHNSPVQGGSGGLATNVFVGAHKKDPPAVDIQLATTSERNTISLFGAGLIEMLAFEMTAELRSIRTEAVIGAQSTKRDVRLPLLTKGISFGFLTAHADGTYDADEISGVDMDLIVKPFGVKGVAVSIREFTNFALNQHDGIESEERFGWARTGLVDFDGDGITSEFSIGQLSALSLYQASLSPPIRVRYPLRSQQQLSEKGERIFRKLGCAECHVPALPLRSAWFFEPNPYNRPGSIIPRDVAGQIALPLLPEDGTALFRDANNMVFVAAFTDLKRHVICDTADPFFCNEKLLQDFVPRDQFLTSKLWDAGTSAPYGHQGNLTTLTDSILHHSAEGRKAKVAFERSDDGDKLALITFLKSLQVDEDN